MNTPARVGAFTLALFAVLGASVVAGRAWGPTLDAEPTAAHDMADAGQAGQEGQMGHADDTTEHLPGGLMRSQDGLTLDLDPAVVAPGAAVPLSFTVRDAAGDPVTDFDVVHGKRLHLIVVRRDLSGFQHVHPSLDPATGRWSTDLALTPGTWRVDADFTATGHEPLTLGTDLAVPGRFTPVALPAPSRVAEVDGYQVRLSGQLSAGTASEVRLSISHHGTPVTDLQPYLGSYGHLVALRDGDLAYLHVHPHEGASAGPGIDFTAEVPSTGRYRLFLDFRHDGVVRTAAFTVEVDR
ncbi:hypothetical protein [Nocardioides mesophilus]|uniref:FixH family protein n=1 Tax=Nocardioides mesophilus TaxID=433659 RepID=A0A7G9RFK4_9ACTN|nr:hypothetical protein [Nocardioides mesophilus]QNN54379.1 hypothetical protein H9L09_08650 [Nocardioides mesophilus]